MKTAEIRRAFIQFFADKGHAVAESSPLVPGNDPTLLFTNAGMVQFKDVFLGFDKRPYTAAVTAQRCLRAGGKHNDLENVGYTARHHTFFEMLGNFSFGEYFKEKAIPYAWEFLTSPAYLGIDKSHLWVTVFGGGDLFGDGSRVPADDEAAALWRQTLTAAGFSEEEAQRRITPIPTADNFWMMGDAGPCGPCSEIFYDPDAGAGRFRGADEEYADVCVEIWNLVFMQYNRDGGELHKLPKPCVDTGMGLERISAVMQQVSSNYDIDLFIDLLAAVRALAAGEHQHTVTASHRIVADHIRSAAFLIADGVLPSNDGRGYVLRRIIRRALRHCGKICPPGEAVFYRLAAPLAAAMGEAYPMLKTRLPAIEAALQKEEENFAGMLKNGLALLEESARALPPGARRLPGETVFKLYDTYGFPPDMTATLLRDEYSLGSDEAGFERCMEEQRARSRAATKFNVGQKTVTYDGAGSDFIGYTATSGEAEVLAMFISGAPVTEAPAGSDVLIILNRTPFYAESGGQIGDTGEIAAAGGRARVDDTQKIRADVWGHVCHVEEGCLKTGDVAQCAADAARRRRIARAHSAAHLMHAALRQTLGTHVEQRGSHVSEDSLRFDFSHTGAVTADELRQVEAIVNRQAAANAEVRTEVMAYDDALKTGAMALFGEKYGERVRVVTIDPAFSVELCGGTHAARAGDIGLFQFTGETAIAAGIRRVEALTADAAVDYAQTQRARLHDIALQLKTPADRVEEKIAQMREHLRGLQKQNEQLQQAQQAQQAAALLLQAQPLGGARALIACLDGADAKALRGLAQQLCGQLPAPAAVFLAGGGDKAAYAAAVAADGGDLSARDWLAAATAAAGAKGGGKADFAQAGGGDPQKREDALAAARAYLAERV